MSGRSWSFAHDRRVIELAKASKSLEDATRIMQRTPERIRNGLSAVGRFIQNRLQEEKMTPESFLKAAHPERWT